MDCDGVDCDGVTFDGTDGAEETPLREAKKEVFRCLNAVLITPEMVLIVDGNVA